MKKTNFFKENNSMIGPEIISLSEFIEFHVSDDDRPLIEFYTVKEDKCITDFVLFIYTTGNMLDFNPNVNACLIYWSGKKWCNTNIETKKRFEKDHPYFHYTWFHFD